MVKVLIILLIALLPMKHPIHVSMTNIEYNIKSNQYDIIIKVFTDDFEANIKKLYKIDLNTAKDSENTKYDIIVSQYVNDFFKINISNKNYKLVYKSKKTNFEATWLNFKLSGFENKDKDFIILNNLMNQYYRDQTNLLIFTKNKFQRAYNMNFNDTIVMFKID